MFENRDTISKGCNTTSFFLQIIFIPSVIKKEKASIFYLINALQYIRMNSRL